MTDSTKMLPAVKQERSVDGLWPPYQTINISEEAYLVLCRWASVSRTLKESLRLLHNYDQQIPLGTVQDGEISDNIEELQQLVAALDDCNKSCKRMRTHLEQQLNEEIKQQYNGK